MFKTRSSPFWRQEFGTGQQLLFCTLSKCELLADAIEEAHILCRQNAIGRAEFEEVETATFAFCQAIDLRAAPNGEHRSKRSTFCL